ncbi:sensor domain-containing diguanylate cyclase [Shewanella sp. SR44-3]|uniref:sensor domain-containing diguanylate cyclase n=2 Tax=Shewanella TaxID=22 RepID=UPI0015F7A3FF|nr:sensor domain-containing diguanylate cyclase [Shewanella sp. SR44-3]MBB1269186.1 GGDEF domain-containing protein [Shewanella sp. SR44-3]
MKQRDSLKRKKIDTLDFRYHIVLLVLPLILFISVFIFAMPSSQYDFLSLSLICIVYLFGYSLSYYLHQGRIIRLWQHLEQVVNINDATYELVHLSSQYQDEHDFLDALLQKAVGVIDGAEMGSIILVNPRTNELKFECTVGLDLSELQKLKFHLEQSFEYRLTDGRCDRVVVVDDMHQINAGSSLSDEEQNILLTAASQPIRSTLSSPIHIDGKLYAMLNLDSGNRGAFNDYDRNLVGILTHEASNAIALYQKSQQIQRLANTDTLTGLYNRKRFEERLSQWHHKPQLGSFLVIIDMDNLKTINDIHGHQAGDNAIVALANAMKVTWPHKALLGRFGGDEFVLICHGPEHKLAAELLELAKLLNNPKSELQVKFSAGVADYQGDWHQAFKQADSAMYLEKRTKKSLKQA